jgi:3-methyladenine DNA glycosylase AlkD
MPAGKAKRSTVRQGSVRAPSITPGALRAALHTQADTRQAQVYMRFFKTGAGQYGEGDRFLGVRMPAIRKLATAGAMLPTRSLAALLKSPWHEERMLALLSLVRRYERSDVTERRQIYALYLASPKYINNWDLIDVTAEHIVGAWLQDKSRAPLLKLARSKSLWERRIAILATFRYIKAGDAADTLRIAEMLLSDEHDLIHKATGWMLREVGKRCSVALLQGLLDRFGPRMPRTMLRYAIEHFPKKKRQRYLAAR